MRVVCKQPRTTVRQNILEGENADTEFDKDIATLTIVCCLSPFSHKPGQCVCGHLQNVFLCLTGLNFLLKPKLQIVFIEGNPHRTALPPCLARLPSPLRRLGHY